MAITIYATIKRLTSAQRSRRVVEILISCVLVGFAIYLWIHRTPDDYAQLALIFVCSQGLSVALLHLYDLIGHRRVEERLKEFEHMPPQVRNLAMLGSPAKQDPFMFIRYWGLVFPFFAVIFFLGDKAALLTPTREYTSYSIVAAVVIFWVWMTLRKRNEDKPNRVGGRF